MPREKDRQKHHEEIRKNLSPRMKAFTTELEEMFPDIVYTSGKRDKAIGKAGNKSHHMTGDAIDLAGNQKEIYNTLYNTKKGVELLVRHGMGIIDETNPDMMKKTGATGAHYHISPDKIFVQKVKDRYQELGEEEPKKMVVFNPSNEPVEIDPEDLTEEINIEKEVSRKTENSEARSELSREEEHRQKIAESLIFDQSTMDVPMNTAPNTSSSTKEPLIQGFKIAETNIQRSLPENQSFFTTKLVEGER